MSSSFSQKSELILPRRSTEAQRRARLSYHSYFDQDPTPASDMDESPGTPVQMPRLRVTTATPLAPRDSARPAKLKPKRSRLSMILSSKPKDKAADPSTAASYISAIPEGRSFEVYADPTDDPEIGEIVVVQRKKSRAALGDVSWANNVESELTVKSTINATEIRERRLSQNLAKENKDGEDKAGWWSRTIGRGRKDSDGEDTNKDGDVKQGRSKSPGPFRSLSRVMMNPLSRPMSPDTDRPANQRAQSSGTGSVFSNSSGASTASTPTDVTPMDGCAPDRFAADPAYATGVPPPSNPNTHTFPGTQLPASLPQQRPLGVRRSAILSFVSNLTTAAPNPRVEAAGEDRTSSLAIRAIKSVKSLARLSSWAQLRGTDEEHAAKNEERREAEKAKKERKEKEKLLSTSSTKTGSISSVGTVGSTRLAAGPARLPMRARLSTGTDSVLSNASGGSGSRTSGGSSVRWDPSCFDTLQDRNRERERSERRFSASSISTKRTSVGSVVDIVTNMKTRDSIERKKYSNRLADARRRGGLPSWSDAEDSAPTTSTFVNSPPPPPTPPTPKQAQTDLQRSILFEKKFEDDSDTIRWSIAAEPATPTPMGDMWLDETPKLKRARPRPVSEQFLGQGYRPAASDDDTLTALNAATSDLESLINRLDLQTPESTPRRSVKSFTLDTTERMPSVQGSPVRRAATTGADLMLRNAEPDAPKPSVESSTQPAALPKGRGHQISLTSLRPYAQCRTVSRRVSGSATTMTVQEMNQVLTGRPIARRLPSSSQISQDAPPAAEPIPKLRPVRSIKDNPTAPVASATLDISTLRASLRTRPSDTIRPNDFKLSTHFASLEPTPEPKPKPHPTPALQVRPKPILQASPRPLALRPARTALREDVPIKTSNVSRPASTTSGNVSSRASSSTTIKKPATPKAAPTRPLVHSRPASSPTTLVHSRPAQKALQTTSTTKSGASTSPAARPVGPQRRTPNKAPTSQTVPPQSVQALRPSVTIGRAQRLQLRMEPAVVRSLTLDEHRNKLSNKSTNEASVEPQPVLDLPQVTTALSAPAVAILRSHSPSLPSPGPPPETPPPIPSPTLASTKRLSLPQRLSIPVFAGDEDEEMDAITPTLDVTGQSFDFTGEIAALGQLNDTDGDSFIDQLETAESLCPDLDISFVGSVSEPSMETTNTDDTLLETLLAEMLHPDDGFSSDGDDESNEDQCVNLGPASRKSHGQLNTEFKFGNATAAPTIEANSSFHVDHNITFVDIIPPYVRANKSSSTVGDDGFMNSGATHVQELPYSFKEAHLQSMASFKQAHGASMASIQSGSDSNRTRHTRGHHGHSPDETSFHGLSAYGDIRNKFEFGMVGKSLPRPSAIWNWHMTNISTTSLADQSVVHNMMDGPAQMVRADDLTEPVDDTFAFQRRKHVRNPSVESKSNRASFHVKPFAASRSEYRRNSLTWSDVDFSGLPTSSVARPGHKRFDATSSPGSVSLVHSEYSVNGSPGLVCPPQERRRDSIGSEFSLPCFDRPEVSDRMFESANFPLAVIAASPQQSVTGNHEADSRLSVLSSVFTRPVRAARDCSGTVGSQLSNGGDTPPLSPSSYSSGSQSSIDLNALKLAMQRSAETLAAHTGSGSLQAPLAHARSRTTSQYSQYSNSFIETIQEEGISPAAVVFGFLFPQTTGHSSVHSTDQDTDGGDLDDTAWLSALRRYHDLRAEAHDEVEMSKRMWMDTRSSMLATQAFDPPSSPTTMKALLKQSQQAYGPLELRTRRVSLRSRTSPYGRTFSLHVQGSTSQLSLNSPSVLLEKSINVPQAVSKVTLAPKPATKNSRAAAGVDSPQRTSILSPPTGPSPQPRQRVLSATRRPILSRKGSTVPAAAPREVKSINRKENVPAPGIVLMSHNPSLRLSRPRPKGRVVSATVPESRNRI